MKKTGFWVLIMVMAVGLSLVWADSEKKTEQDTSLISTSTTSAPVDTKMPFQTETEKLSYCIGVNVGKSIKAGDFEVDRAVLIRAIQDVLNDRPLLLADEQITQIMNDFRTEMMAKRQEEIKKRQEEMKKQGETNLTEGKDFLENNAKKEGVKVLPSGLQYKVLTPGTGAMPKATDRVKTHYRGTLINGKEFDSSYKRGEPTQFPVNRVIQGWQEALQLMKEGGKWQLFIPADLAYGQRGTPDIPANSVLIFDIELLEIVKDQAKQE